MADQYLSTDPNAGASATEYLSTDPNAGQPVTNPTAAKIPLPPSLLQRLSAWLPAAGGVAGAVVGGGIPGAIAGGVGGEALRQMVTGEQPSYTKVAEQGALQGAAEGVGAAIGAVAKPAAERLMQGALKPGLKTLLKGDPAQAPGVVRTLLDEGINVTRGGVEKLNALLSATNDEIKDAIASVPASINPFKVTSRLGPTAQRFAQQVNPASDLEAVSRAGQEFLETHGGQAIPVQTAQALKTGTYRQLAGKYGELKGAEIEAQKSLARGLKEEIAAEVQKTGVDLNALNAREGALIETRDATARRVALSSNRDPMGLASLAVSHPLTFLTVLADRSPAVKSMLARGLWSSAGAASKVSPQVIRAAAAAVASGSDEESR